MTLKQWWKDKNLGQRLDQFFCGLEGHAWLFHFTQGHLGLRCMKCLKTSRGIHVPATQRRGVR